MNRFHFIIFGLILILSSCIQPTSNKVEEEENRKAQFPIVGFVENFVASHPNFDSNDITRKQADGDFLKSFTDVSDSTNLIKGIPVKLEDLCEDSKGRVMAHFQSWIKPSAFEFPLPIQDVYFDVVGAVNSQYVNTLNEDTYYTIHGKFVSKIDNLPAFRMLLGRSSSVYAPQFQVRKDDIWDDRFEVSLGMMYFDIDSISEFKY